jgi:hypothetical protein
MNAAELRAELYSRRLPLAAIAVSLACLVLSLAIRPAPQLAAIDAAASALDLKLSHQLLFEQSIGLKPGGARFGLVKTATLDGAAASPEAALAALASAKAGALELVRLVVASRSTLSVRGGADGCVTLAVLAGEARIDLASDANDASVIVPGRNNGASEFALCPAEPLELALYGASDIEFQRNFRPNTAQSYRLSSLASASLAFPALGVERRIVPLSGLRIARLGDRAPLILEAEPGKSAITVRYVGDAYSILSGPPDNRREQMPRLLEYLIGHAPLATLLAGFGFFWGLIWGLVKFSRSSAQS